MIGRSNRFHGRAGIQRLMRSGQSVRSSAFALKFTPNPKRSSYRLAVVVSRKVSKSAVVRNRIRRRIYERVRILSSSFPVACDMAIMVYDGRVADMPAQTLDADLTALIKKAGLASAGTAPHAIVEPKGKS